MKSEDAATLRLLGYVPEQCLEIGHTELGRHAVYASGNEIIKLYGSNGGVSAEARARAEQKYSALARARGVNAPVTLRLGEAAGRHFTVSERLPGSTVAGDVRNEIWREIGRLLGAFHAPVLQDGRPWLEKWRLYCRECAALALKYPCGERAGRTIASAAERIEADALASRFAVLPMGTCHGDFSLRNVLCECGCVSGVIDFELASESNVELELARLCRAEFSGGSDRAKAFLAGYRESAYLAPDFAARLPLYLAGESLFACSWSFHAVPEHFQESVDWLAKYLSRCDAPKASDSPFVS